MNGDKIRNACVAAVQAINKLKTDEFAELRSKLEYCIGSYDYDKNPVGLIEYGAIVLRELKAYKATHPRKINKKVIADLEKNLV